MTQEPRVLVADDDPPLRKLVATCIRRYAGLTVREVSNGAQAIEHLSDCSWDVLVLDLMMPTMSGWDVLSWLSNHRDCLPRTVIVASAADDIALSKLDAAVVNAVLLKPFDVFQLGAYVKAACDRTAPDRRRKRFIPAAPGAPW